MKKTVLSMALLGVCSIASAQLSTRENNDTRYKLGARPVAGDYALTFGVGINSTEVGGRDIPAWNLFGRGNLITGKKYISDDMAFRMGLRLFRDSRTLTGELDSTENITNVLSEVEFRSSQRQYMLVPGIEKHFSNSNIFDVYTGADLYLGFGKDKEVSSTTNRDGETDAITETTPYTLVGLGGVIGVSVFVIDLPISVGVEYGLSAFWKLGDRTKVEVEEADGDTYEYQTVSDDPFSAGLQYNSVKQKYMTMDTNDQVRLVVNIYFN
ncbi:MAG: hypothetical protein IPN62_04585 [Flavobacteriales bacterium]|jgi:hypothetical protein|nr:hypothetical protein [Flavobacteriales bacterium]MBP7450309.1 hypothetical protein [Flavobacteriales bacterium]HOZ41058.1 hypothetical protein [Flavobacteriales bacterium]